MSAYIIVQNVVTDAARMEQYVPMAVETLVVHGAEILAAADEATVLDGESSFPRTVILKFASREAAMAWYQSPEYQEALPLRLQSTRGFLVLVDGLDDTAP